MEIFPDFIGTFNPHTSGFIEESVKYIPNYFSFYI